VARRRNIETLRSSTGRESPPSKKLSERSITGRELVGRRNIETLRSIMNS
jgi:hypothetical protein